MGGGEKNEDDKEEDVILCGGCNGEVEVDIVKDAAVAVSWVGY